MITSFVRPSVQGLQPAAAAPQAQMQAQAQAQVQAQAQAQTGSPSAMENALNLDLQTSWPTHRIRSFLSLQPR